MGSEMCIRDRWHDADFGRLDAGHGAAFQLVDGFAPVGARCFAVVACATTFATGLDAVNLEIENAMQVVP